MLLYLDSSVGIALSKKTSAEYLNVIRALDCLALSRCEGNHILLGEYEVLRMLKEHPDLSAHSRSVYLQIFNDLPTTMGLCEIISPYIRIHSDGAEGSSRNEINVNIRTYQHLELAQKTILLGENLNDALFFVRLGEFWIRHKQLGTICIRATTRGGGGDTTAPELQCIADSISPPCLCICDSDKKSPVSFVGGTAKKLQALNVPNDLVHLMVIEPREVENILPTPILDRLYSADDMKIDSINILYFLDQCAESSLRFYLDMKNGVAFRDVRKQFTNKKFKKFWLAYLSLACVSGSERIGQCGAEQCSNCKPNCKHIIFRPLGQGVLSDALLYIDKDTLLNSIKQSPQDVFRVLDDIGRLVACWCCGCNVEYAC